MTISERVAARYIKATRLHMGPARKDDSATASLAKMTLKSKNRGDLQSAVISAGFHAKRTKETMYVYPGNSYGHGVWRVSNKAAEYLDPINNTGEKILAVTPDLVVSWHDVNRPDADSTE